MKPSPYWLDGTKKSWVYRLSGGRLYSRREVEQARRVGHEQGHEQGRALTERQEKERRARADRLEKLLAPAIRRIVSQHDHERRVVVLRVSLSMDEILSLRLDGEDRELMARYLGGRVASEVARMHLLEREEDLRPRRDDPWRMEEG